MQIIDGNVYQDTWTPAWGLGKVGDMSTSGIASVAAQGAATTLSLVGGISTAMTVAAGGVASEATVLGISAAAFPIIGAAIAGLTAVAIAIAKVFSGCGQTCVQASNIANQVEQALIANLQHYVSSPVRYASMQAAALNNFDTAWQALTQACGAQALQQAGVNCIQDRSAGSCKWKATAGSWSADGKTWTPAGPAGSGDVCWNWFVGYRDPISNDPGVVPDPTPQTTTNPSIQYGAGDNPQTQIQTQANPLSNFFSGGVTVGSTQIPMLAIIGGIILLVALGDK